jgi:hypothetical protein
VVTVNPNMLGEVFGLVHRHDVNWHLTCTLVKT